MVDEMLEKQVKAARARDVDGGGQREMYEEDRPLWIAVNRYYRVDDARRGLTLVFAHANGKDCHFLVHFSSSDFPRPCCPGFSKEVGKGKARGDSLSCN
jgi:hypothetical protein